MKNMLIRSVIASVVICLAGTALNLMTYFMYQSMLLGIKVSRGEWTGKRGMGMLLKEGTLSLDPMSFLVPFAALFFFVLIVEWRKYVIIKQMMQE